MLPTVLSFRDTRGILNKLRAAPLECLQSCESPGLLLTLLQLVLLVLKLLLLLKRLLLLQRGPIKQQSGAWVLILSMHGRYQQRNLLLLLRLLLRRRC